MTSNATRINGLVLIGGLSKRMGQDKSELTYHQKPQRDHLTDLLKPYCDTVYWSVNASQAASLSDAGQPLIVDAFDNLVGPLNGIMSAFQTAPDTAWLAVACDMPFLTTESLDVLINGRDVTKNATCFYDSDGRFPEPLLCVWEPSFWPILQQSYTDGAYSPRRILMLNDIHLLTAPSIRELTNINDAATRARLGL